MIPMKLHRIWVGSKPIPDEYEGWWRRFAELNPGWQLETWRDPDPDAFELGRLFASATSGAQLSDLMRLEILWRDGGFYVDADVEPIRPLAPLLEHELVIAHEPDGWCLLNTVIGARSGHPGIRAVIDELLLLDRLPEGVPPNKSTGPELVNRILRGRSDVTVVSPTTFYPYAFGEKRVPPASDTLVAHHWAATWVPTPPLWRRLARPLARRVRRYRRLAGDQWAGGAQP